MIELQDEIEAECVNNTELWVRSNRRTPLNQTLRLWLQLWPHFQSPSPSLSATRHLWTPPPYLHCALRWIYVTRTWVGRYRFRQEPTDEVLREKGEKKKKRQRRGALNVLEFGGKKDKKEKRTGTCVEDKKRGKKKGKRKKCSVWRIKKEEGKKEKRRMKYYHNFFTINFKG